MIATCLVSLLFFTACGSDTPEGGVKEEVKIEITPTNLTLPGEGKMESVKVSSTAKWKVISDENWCTPSPAEGYAGETILKITALKNNTEQPREATLTFTSGNTPVAYKVKQERGKTENYVPQGYTLVWQDEFDQPRLADGKPAIPGDDKWWFETGGNGWGNNELQNYINRIDGKDTCAVVTNGVLKIIAMKKGQQVISIRMNTHESWTYGYFEARLKLPSGRGTWPAFWMMPKHFQSWPADGEIDIMEEVGYRPNWVSSAIHCTSYNHSIGTEKTGEQYIATAQSDFHIYAIEWTTDYIKGFVDGKEHFFFQNDKKGNKDTWPFDKPFYVKLNLAWGGNWGGAEGVDESVLPATYEIDYVRVYQKK